MAVAPSERTRSVFGSAMSPGLEKAYWYFLRVSGVALVFLAGGHLFVTHYLNVPSETTFDFVSARWANPLWRTFDTLLLLAALFLWWGSRAVPIWRSASTDRYAVAASIVTAAILVHSIVDYPLRTAALSSIFAACLALMARPRARDGAENADLWPTARHLAV